MLRFLPLVVGILGGLSLICNRIFTDPLTVSQSRSDALGILESAVLVLTFLLAQQVQPIPPVGVQLQGTESFVMSQELPELLQAELAWLSHTLITQTVTRSVLIWYDGRVIHRRGIFSEQLSQEILTLGPIAQKVMTNQKSIYLVQLSLYPGRAEFNYLPINTQGVIVQPLSHRGFMVLGAYVSRSYTNQEESWIAALAAKITYSLDKANLN